MRWSLFFVVPAVCALGALSACGSDGSPQVLQESITQVGELNVRVTLDDSLGVCTTFPSSSPDCLSAQTTPGSGIQSARLDAVPGGPYVLRLLVEPGAQFDDLPADQARMPVAMKTELVMALYDEAPACFRMTGADGEAHTVTVTATAVDGGTGITTAAPAESSC
jgi:hypothetical protein